MGLGVMMPGLFANLFQQAAGGEKTAGTAHCPDCGGPVSPESRFCPIAATSLS
jgi:hypothetical protein